MNPCREIALACTLLGCALSALAQYKVVGPDGRVTYTDRPPSAASAGQVTPMRRDGSAAAPDAQLPIELRQPVARFPVTLYSAADCAPCESGRRLLQARGVPYVEKLVSDEADSDALARLSDVRTVPVLTVGKQVLKGYSEADWQSTLDLATYPRESRLPRSHVQPAATPLTAKAPPPRPVAPEPAPVVRPEPAPPPPGPGPSIRF